MLVIPRSIKVDRSGFDITWADSHHSFYTHRELRANCQCAGCVDEWTRQRRVNLADIPENIESEDWIEVGQYAIQILWSDGHSTGIYPFTLLRSLCSCEICEAVRSTKHLEE